MHVAPRKPGGFGSLQKAQSLFQVSIGNSSSLSSSPSPQTERQRRSENGERSPGITLESTLAAWLALDQARGRRDERGRRQPTAPVNKVTLGNHGSFVFASCDGSKRNETPLRRRCPRISPADFPDRPRRRRRAPDICKRAAATPNEHRLTRASRCRIRSNSTRWRASA